MLSDRHYQLLTAYIDGELSARERRTVERLLCKSPEARTILEKLENDSKELRRLPVRQAPETLADVVMQTLSDDLPRTPAKPLRPTAAARLRRAISPWLGFAAAACVLVMVGLGSFALFGRLLEDKADNEMSQREEESKPNQPVEIVPPPVMAKGLDPLVGDLFAGAAEKFAAKVDAKDSYVSVAVGQLHEAPARQRLTTVLKKDPAVRLDLPVTNSAKAVDRLKEAFKNNGITVLVDAAARNHLGNPKKRAKDVSFVLYAENLKAEELAQVLQAIGKAEASTMRTIDVVSVTGMTPNDRTDLSKMLNVAVKDLQPGKFALPPLIESPPKATSKNPGMVRPVERLALVLAKGEGLKLNPANSLEIRKFLEARKGIRLDMLQVVLTIHETTI
jgi:hypothetical protein